jgi:hypothetical protein
LEKAAKKSPGQDEKTFSFTRYPIPKPYVISAYLFLIIIFLTFGSIIFSSQSNWCGACHVIRTEVTSWKVSSHSKLDCLSCHRDTGMLSIPSLQLRGLKHLVSWIFDSYSKPISTDVESRFCLYCHPTTVEKVIESSAIRVSHREFTPQLYACTDCHSDAGHSIKARRKNQPNMDRCLVCHNGKKASTKCDLCHTKELPDEIVASAKSPYLIIHGDKGKKTHGMGDTKTCQICHRKDFCRNCHLVDLPHPSNAGYSHGKEARESAKPCWVCHQRSYCDGCHGLEMPHPADFLSQHAKLTEKNGKKFCDRCHIDYTCDYCHRLSLHPPPVQGHVPRLSGVQ